MYREIISALEELFHRCFGGDFITQEEITLDDIKDEMGSMLDYWKIQLDKYIEFSIQDRIREIENNAYTRGYDDGYEIAELHYKNKENRRRIRNEQKLHG